MGAEHDIREECKTWRDEIVRRMEEAEAVGKKVNVHDVDIGVLKTNMENLTRSLGGLTKAIWGLVVMVLGTLVGFFVWYVQGIPH
jgi:hypothetical protein